ncbi:SWIM zinc finger family protein [Paenibacillus sp. VCA1]|uniref:SWIM zinc finger family protein n=1 Tax=Paenibacillus sp. VCA1 TaxID=3039148 RepID=UPI0028716051|nr:SWIM zinc finger family protein [Paenibacillus sp. VCA1]MDR9857030.1 SWIM zinc finger family protein [Paenibacillus sp. VCA1]
MKTNHTITDMEWQKLIADVGEHFSDVTIKRGFQFYKQGFVREVKADGAGGLQAFVGGAEPQEVFLETGEISASRCACPEGSGCKHIVAVLLEYASMQGRSVHAIVNAHAMLKFRTPHHVALEENEVPAQTGEFDAGSALREKALQIPNASIAEWHALFKTCVAPLEFGSPNAQYARKAIAAIEAVKPRLSPGMEQLYDLHAHLFMLIKLVKPAHPLLQTGTYLGYHVQVAADDMLKAIKEILDEGIGLAAEPELWPRVTKTLTYLRRQMLTESKNFNYLFEAYDRLWRRWLRPNLEDDRMFKEEIEKLKTAEEDLGDGLSRLSWMLAHSRIYFFMGEDRQAWTWLRDASKGVIVPPGFLFSFAEEIAAAEEWPRLVEWLVFIGPLLSGPRKDQADVYMDHWRMAVRHHPESEERMWEALSGMLPYSLEMYEEALLDYGKWQQWMDMQLSAGTEPLALRVSVLQPLEKEAPELLLPFYHQAVERHLLLKNRSGYKAAVKLLKRLAKLYKKMKREERWEQFLETFVSRNGRLRALQEELRKGKLIS